MQRTSGYIVSGIGLILLALSIGPIYSQAGFLQGIPSGFLMWIGVALAIIGVAFSGFVGKKSSEKEVPIYSGKNVVGYRRVK